MAEAEAFARRRPGRRLHADRRIRRRAPAAAFPWCRWCTPLYAPFVHEWGSEVLGIDVGALLDRPYCVLALQPPGFDPPGPLPNGTDLRRRSAAARTRPQPRPGRPRPADQAGDPWVLLSLSTTLQGQAEALPGLLGALGPLTGPRAADTRRGAGPDSVDARRTT